MSASNRPLSPHLQVYRLPLSAILSVLHRATGVFLTLGTLLLVWWLLSVAEGESAYLGAQAVMGSFLGQLVLLGWTFSLFFHLANGIRHLFWDVGYGFDNEVVEKTSLAVIGGAAGLTVLVWIVGLAAG